MGRCGETFGLDEARMRPFSGVCSRHFVGGGGSHYGPLPALLTPMPYPVAIAEEEALTAVTTNFGTNHGSWQ